MNNLKRIMVVAIVAMCASMSAMAQFAWGPKLGLALNDVHFSKEVWNDITNTSNHEGFTGGVFMEYMVPVLGIGFDASLMYVHRPTQTVDVNDKAIDATRDYLELPINFKYKIGLPVVGRFVTPYVFTGPSFAVLMSKKDITEAIESESLDIAWNVGVGLQLFSKLQVGASYGFGLSKSIVGIKSTEKIEGKNRYWTVTAAWMF